MSNFGGDLAAQIQDLKVFFFFFFVGGHYGGFDFEQNDISATIHIFRGILVICHFFKQSLVTWGHFSLLKYLEILSR